MSFPPPPQDPGDQTRIQPQPPFGGQAPPPAGPPQGQQGWQQPQAPQAPGWQGGQQPQAPQWAQQGHPQGGFGGPGGGQLAGWGARVAAAIVDALIVGVVATPILFGIVGTEAGFVEQQLVSIPIGLVLAALYYGFLYARKGPRNGQSLGKQLLNIRVVRKNGQPFDAGSAIVREVLIKTLLFGYLAVFTLYIATLLNYLWPLWDKQNQALHDKLGGTFVHKA